MAVRALAGPIPMQAGSIAIPTWWPHVGLMVYAPFSVLRATLDGEARPFAAGFFLTGLNWWPARNRMVGLYGVHGEPGTDEGTRGEFVVEPKTGWIQWCGPNDQPTEGIWGSYVKLADRRLAYASGRLIAYYPGRPPEIEGPPCPTGWSGHLGVGRSPTEICITPVFGSSGVTCFYDTVNKVFDKKTYIVPFRFGICYSPEHEVFIGAYEYSGDPGGSYYVWSMETYPTQFSAVMVHKGTVKSGQIVTYKVQLTGDAIGVGGGGSSPRDGAEGELIDWTLEGAGILLDPQTETDIDGWAYTRVQYRVGETGSTALTASCTC